MPSVIGLDKAKAKEILEELGYEVIGKWGSLADREEQISRVERQEPDAKTTLPPGEAVTIWIFKKPPAKAAKE